MHHQVYGVQYLYKFGGVHVSKGAVHASKRGARLSALNVNVKEAFPSLDLRDVPKGPQSPQWFIDISIGKTRHVHTVEMHVEANSPKLRAPGATEDTLTSLERS